jgi:alkanesulfonate monooxygenase SsuD/methylene tetrahydromethanopterin reductase-like flavin-dependent oxidoreductase (luciferase family)
VPMMAGGNGDRMLAVAARGAKIVQFTGFTAGSGQDRHRLSHFTTGGLADRVDYVRRLAGDRFADLELSLLVQRAMVVPDPRAAFEELLADSPIPVADALDSPFMLAGSVDAICDRIRQLQERFGISYLTVFDGRNDGFDQVVSRLA